MSDTDLMAANLQGIIQMEMLVNTLRTLVRETQLGNLSKERLVDAVIEQLVAYEKGQP